MTPQRGVLGLQVCYLLVFGSAVSLGLLQKLIEVELSLIHLLKLLLLLCQLIRLIVELSFSLIRTLLPLGDSSAALQFRLGLRCRLLPAP